MRRGAKQRVFGVKYSARNVYRKGDVETFTTTFVAKNIAEAKAQLLKLKAWHRRKRNWKFRGLPSEIIPLGVTS